jgi:hypothetical protein
MRSALVRGLLLATAFIAAAACGSFSNDSAGGSDGGAEATSLEGGGPPADGAVDASEGGALADQGLVPFEIAKGLADLQGIAITETTVYAAQHQMGIVLAVPIDGGSITIVSANAGAPIGLAIAGGYLFWSDFGGAKISRASLTTNMLATSAVASKPSVAIAPAVDRVVTAAAGTSSAGEVQQYTFDLNTGPSVTGLNNPWDVAVFGGLTYWTESSGGRIGSGKIGDATNVTFLTGESDCRAITADATGVYWTRPAGGLVRGSLTANPGGIDLAKGETAPHSLTSDGLALYWLTSDGKVRRRPHSTPAAVTTLAEGLPEAFSEPHVRALAVNSNYVVWLTTDGRILRLPK